MAHGSWSSAPARGGTARVRSCVLDRRYVTEARPRAPRPSRPDVQAAPEVHVAPVAQAFVGEESGTPLAVLYDSVPPPLATEGLRRLEQRLAETLA